MKLAHGCRSNHDATTERDNRVTSERIHTRPRFQSIRFFFSCVHINNADHQ